MNSSPILLALGGLSCGGSELPCLVIDCQSEDTTILSGSPEIERVAWGCCVAETDPSCPESGAFWTDLVLTGAADSVELQLTQVSEGTSTYQELHPIPQVILDAHSNWSIHFLEIPTKEFFEAGLGTLFTCDQELLDQVNWTILLSPESSDEENLCGTWGEDLDSSAECLPLIPDP